MDKQAVEQTGLVPRSILRTFERFRRQLLPGGENLVIQEFRISRYQVLVSVKCLLTLAILPFFINYIVKWYFLTPLTKYLWNTSQNEIFLNSYQQKRAFFEMQNFEEQIFFESLLENQDSDFFNKFQKKTIELAKQYNQESIEAISNIFGDFFTLGTISLLVRIMKPQIIILKSFLTESIYSLSDTTKSFLLILFTDLLVGFHSPKGWEFFLELILQHFGLPENQEFIFLFVATFPVLLDTVFKYWIFRYLNKISPSTVATYHNMIE